MVLVFKLCNCTVCNSTLLSMTFYTEESSLFFKFLFVLQWFKWGSSLSTCCSWKQNFVESLCVSYYLLVTCSLIFINSCSSLSCSFSLSALFISSVSFNLLFLFSLLQLAASPIRCRRGYIQTQEGITEKTSLVTTISVAMLFTNFYKWFRLKSWMKNDNTQKNRSLRASHTGN